MRSLKELRVANNKIKVLGPLPPSLSVLDISSNAVVSLQARLCLVVCLPP